MPLLAAIKFHNGFQCKDALHDVTIQFIVVISKYQNQSGIGSLSDQFPAQQKVVMVQDYSGGTVITGVILVCWLCTTANRTIFGRTVVMCQDHIHSQGKGLVTIEHFHGCASWPFSQNKPMKSTMHGNVNVSKQIGLHRASIALFAGVCPASCHNIYHVSMM